jgi:SAM-dependent methyltransferase
MDSADLLQKMKRDWDNRARENFQYYIVNSRTDWSDEDFMASGDQTVGHYVLTDMENVCQGKRPCDMKVLDFGCGAGRVTRSLAKLFGEVHGVDISSEMLKLAGKALADLPNIRLYETNGQDLDVLGDLLFDFAFAFSVFHHIPGKAIIENCIEQVGRHLRSGCLFKFEVQGHPFEAPEGDTWLGTPLSERDMLEIADRTGFESRYRVGEGKESYWHWFFKK